MISVSQIEEKCVHLMEEKGIDIVFIDYLQLINADKGRYRDEEVSKVMNALKKMAKKLDVPVVVLSQLSRAVETRKEGTKIPQLSDLRESGSIEQTADVVMFLYRPDYYDITCNEVGESNFGETYMKIAKNRVGPLDTIKLKALLNIQKFVDAEEEDSFLSNNSEFSTHSIKWGEHFENEEKNSQDQKSNEEDPF